MELIQEEYIEIYNKLGNVVGVAYTIDDALDYAREHSDYTVMYTEVYRYSDEHGLKKVEIISNRVDGN